MDVYEHTYDIVEQQRLLQIIVDIMAKRPRLNVDATHFIDSYKSDIKYIDAMTDLIDEVVRDQKNTERDVSNSIKEHLELKYRKINEHINRKWEYRKQDGKVADSQQQDASNQDDNENDEKEEKKARLANIAKRHITDFTKNYDQDFTDVLGLPEITADDLFK